MHPQVTAALHLQAGPLDDEEVEKLLKLTGNLPQGGLRPFLERYPDRFKITDKEGNWNEWLYVCSNSELERIFSHV